MFSEMFSKTMACREKNAANFRKNAQQSEDPGAA